MPDSADPGLDREIQAIRAIDDHAHLPIFPDPEPDLDHLVQPYDFAVPLRLRPDNPEYIDAWKALWGYEHDGWSPEHLRELFLHRQALKESNGDAYYPWILDKLGTDTLLYISPAPLPHVKSRYRWVAHIDSLLWPFQTIPADKQALAVTYSAVNARRCAEAGLDGPPPTLNAYLTDIVGANLQAAKVQGAIAVKSNAPYYRDLSFENVSADDAARLYAQGQKEGGLPVAEHKAFQDYAFRWVMARVGELGLPFQMHTGLGAKPGFATSGSNPLLMEGVFTDFPRTKFVLLHAGWPFDRETRSAMAYENVFVDLSCANLYFYARNLADVVRGGIEWFPERVVFGTDAHTDSDLGFLASVPSLPNPLAGWEEKAWLSGRVTRKALGLAVTGMVEDGVVTGDRAVELAQMVMRGNSLALYNLDDA
jgi:hypothetical protein